jgi:hypothetical protein
MPTVLTPEALALYAAPILQDPHGMTAEQCIKVWNVKHSHGVKILHLCRKAGLIDQTHRYSIRNLWAAPDLVPALRAQIDMATPKRTLNKIKSQRLRKLQSLAQPEANDDAEVDAWMETKPRHIVGQAWETPKPPGPRSIFEVAACR